MGAIDISADEMERLNARMRLRQALELDALFRQARRSPHARALEGASPRAIARRSSPIAAMRQDAARFWAQDWGLI